MGALTLCILLITVKDQGDYYVDTPNKFKKQSLLMKFSYQFRVSTLLLLACLFTAGCDRAVRGEQLDRTAASASVVATQVPKNDSPISDKSSNDIPNKIAAPGKETDQLVVDTEVLDGTVAKTIQPKAGCTKALELINTCAYESTCDSDITTNLPSEPRSHFNTLSQQGWFRSEVFTKYCVDACKSKSPKIVADTFKFEVCGYADDLSTGKKYEPIIEALNIEGKVKTPVQGVELKVISAKFGKSLNSKNTPYGCDSAFSEKNTQLQEYSSFSLETNDKTGVIRSIEMNGVNSLLLTNGKIVTSMTEQQFNSAYALQTVKLDSHVYRSAATKDSGLESAYYFYFKDGKLIKVMYWIAC
jgi:hypothetical protein